MPGSAVLDQSLVDDLVPVIDELRSDLLDDMGIRPYRTFLVTRTWSGGAVGVGTPTDISEELRPIPRIHQWNDRVVQKVCGILGEGEILLSEASLTGTFLEMGAAEPPAGAQYMLRVDEGHGQQNPSRYYTHLTTFVDREDSIGWYCRLKRVQA